MAGTTRDVTERKQAEERASLLSELAAKLAPLTTEQEMIQVTVEAVGRHLDVHRCYFVEPIGAGDIIVSGPNWVRGAGRSLQGTHRLTDFGGEVWWNRHSDSNLAVEDVRSHPLTSDKAAVYEELGIRSFVVKPFEKLNRWTVVLTVTEEYPRLWTPEELELLDNVVARVWPRVEQARTLEAIHQSQHRLALVAEAGKVILETDTMPGILHRICHMAGKHLNSDISLTLLPKAEGKELETEYGFGLKGGLVREIVEIYSRERTTGFLEQGTFSGADEKAATVLAGEGVLGYSSHPLMVGDELLGIMVFASRMRGGFSEAELEFLSTLAQYITGAYVRLRLLDSLRESDKRKDQFLATLAHELRNPLAPILTGLEIMQRSGDDPSTINHVSGIIQGQTGQMVHLINDLLDLSRVNTGKIVLKRETVPFKQILESALEASQPFIEERKHSLEVELPPPSVFVNVDPSRVSQVVSNLLSNAAKYTPPGGRIRLLAGWNETDAWVRVSDNGLGIDLSDQQSIFELFQQTANGSSDGLGIGLTLVKSLVEMHGGSVEVSSEGRSKGSEFGVTLNNCVSEAQETAPAEIPMTAIPSGTKRVLVVDDGKNAADMLAMFFQMEGMEVETAYDGQQALDKALAFSPDLVIMDLGMPVMDGLEAARKMRAADVDAILIALSGWGRDEDKQRTAEAGFNDHMIKPICPNDLRQIMAKYFPAS